MFKSAYKLKPEGGAITGSFQYVPSDFIEYEEDTKSQELIDAEAFKTPEQIRQEKAIALSEITVTTSNNNTFDGDDIARADMMSAISASETLDQTSTMWKLANNSWKDIGVAEMKEAQALAIQAKGAILNA